MEEGMARTLDTPVMAKRLGKLGGQVTTAEVSVVVPTSTAASRQPTCHGMLRAVLPGQLQPVSTL